MPLMSGINPLRDFLRLESAAAIVLLAAAALALLVQNGPYAWLYDALLDLPASVAVGPFVLDKPLLLWINEGLMAVFFLLVGLEIKREALEGELAAPGQALLPVVAAAGGMAAPALIFVLFNLGRPAELAGWAVPTATDIAFALGALALLGERVPLSLKTFLLTIAVADDLGAIVLIAVFHTAELSYAALAPAGALVATLAALNLFGVTRRGAYIVVGALLWAAVVKSGVHATLAGVVLALAVPLRARDADGRSPLRHLEQSLHPWVAFGILPLFGFANAGIRFADLAPATMLAPLPAGIALGLVLGKPLGVLGAAYAAVKSGLARLPNGTGWPEIAGVAMLCGIGFTMSLFIGTLAFEDPARTAAVRLGTIAGSLLSALCGLVVLRWVAARADQARP